MNFPAEIKFQNRRALSSSDPRERYSWQSPRFPSSSRDATTEAQRGLCLGGYIASGGACGPRIIRLVTQALKGYKSLIPTNKRGIETQWLRLEFLLCLGSRRRIGEEAPV